MLYFGIIYKKAVSAMIWLDWSEFINIGSLLGFLFGILFGFTLFALLYLYAVLKSLHRGKYLVDVQSYDIDAKEIELMVKEYQDDFRNNKLKGMGPNIVETVKSSKEMGRRIAETFYPDSKYPLYEISLDEAIMLATYVTERLDEVLSHRGLKMFRKIKISQIIKWSTVAKTFEDSAIMQVDKKYKIRKRIKTIMGAINLLNPVYWFRKVVVDKSTNIVVRKICILVIGIIGEEMYKVYSKSLFNEEMQINVNPEDLFNELRDELDREGMVEEEGEE